MCPDDPTTSILLTMIDIIGSQVPYQWVILTIHMLHTQGLAASYQQRFTTDTALDEVVITPDVITFGNFALLSCYLVNFNEIPLNDMGAGYVVTISDYLITNDNMWI